MNEYTITPEQAIEAKEQTDFLIDNAPEILFKYMDKQRRQEIESKLGISITKARKILLSSRLQDNDNIEDTSIPEIYNPEMFLNLSVFQKLKLKFKKWMH